MTLSAIAAMAKNRVIGVDNKIPWHLPEDLQYYKKTTWGHKIVMGRRTFASIGNKPLPGRENIVLTHDRNFHAEWITVVHSIDEIVEKFRDSAEEVFVVGGAALYEKLLPHVDKVYLTLIHKDFAGDKFFPKINLDTDYHILKKSEMMVSKKNHLPFQFVVGKKI